MLLCILLNIFIYYHVLQYLFVFSVCMYVFIRQICYAMCVLVSKCVHLTTAATSIYFFVYVCFYAEYRFVHAI